MKSMKSALGLNPYHSPTRAYEDQETTIKAGYQPKYVEGNSRASSQPPPGTAKAPDEDMINAPSLASLGIHLEAQEGQARFGPHRKRTSSVYPEGRPPKLPPAATPTPCDLSPLSPDLLGTNVDYPSPPDSQSPPENGQQGSGGTEFFDIYDVQSPPRKKVATLPLGQTEGSGVVPTVASQGGNNDDAPMSEAASNDTVISSLAMSSHPTPQKQVQEGQTEKERNLSRTPPRIHRTPTPPAERGASSSSRGGPFETSLQGRFQ